MRARWLCWTARAGRCRCPRWPGGCLGRGSPPLSPRTWPAARGPCLSVACDGRPGDGPLRAQAAEAFADEVAARRVPSVRAIRARLHVGQPRGQRVRAYLATLTSTQKRSKAILRRSVVAPRRSTWTPDSYSTEPTTAARTYPPLCTPVDARSALIEYLRVGHVPHIEIPNVIAGQILG